MTFDARQLAAPARRPTILICDDEEDLLVVLEKRLRLEKFEVLSTRGVDEALEALDNWKVSAVVVDLNLREPGDGIKLVRAVHAWHRGVSCIAFTGFDCSEATRLGIPCVHKGDGSFRELVSKLRAVLGYGPYG